METNVVSAWKPPWNTAPVAIRMLGRLAINRAGAEIDLPASRKVRALLGYLSLAPKSGVARGTLCELLWDLPSDPRGELRWCLSKLRRLIDEPGHRRVHAGGDIVWLDLSDSFLDTSEIEREIASIDVLPPEHVRELEKLFAGDFLAGLNLDSSAQFHAWLTAQRQRFHAYHVRLLERLLQYTRGDEVLELLHKWQEIAPLDERVHERLLQELVRRNRVRDGTEHVASAVRLFEAEGLDGAPLREAWESAKSRAKAIQAGDDSDGLIAPRRASLAVMPFVDYSDTGDPCGDVADALVHDVITKLAKLRTLSIIAQGSVFALRNRGVTAQDAGPMLNVDYVASGSLHINGSRVTVTVEVSDVRTRQIVWADAFTEDISGTLDIVNEIADTVVASISSEIEASERNRAVLRPPNSLDAWQAHHRGLWHMYRFTKLENDRAQQFFEMATHGDPTFSRAWAGLSFTHFQNAFQGWEERGAQIDRALETAKQSLMADDRDPAAHWAMGRALWLHGERGDSFSELEQAISLSPNFALGHYTLAFVHSQSGDPQAAIAFSDRSRRLSPYDPLLFGMLASHAMALARTGRFDEAAHLALQAVARPNAHVHILAIAAFCLALARRRDEARRYVERIQAALPGYRVDDFVAAMRFDTQAERLFRHAAASIGL